MNKIKQFLNKNQDFILGTTIAVTMYALSKNAYKKGYMNGFKDSSVTFMAMINADLDETCAVVQDVLEDLGTNKEFIYFGRKAIKILKG